MKKLAAFAFSSALTGAILALLVSDALVEAAIIGALIGGSMGLIAFFSRHSATVAFEYEAAGLPDDNLITTARRNLVREAYRHSYSPRLNASDATKADKLAETDAAALSARKPFEASGK